MRRAHVLSVNVGRPAPFRVGGRTLTSAFVKTPVSGPVAARGVNLEGDDQGDRAHHGGADQAVYAYAGEDAAWWAQKLGRPLAPASFGENLTLAITGQGVLRADDRVEIVHRPEHGVSIALVIEALLIDRSRLDELAPARADMLPKLAGWYDEAVYASTVAGSASAAS